MAALRFVLRLVGGLIALVVVVLLGLRIAAWWREHDAAPMPPTMHMVQTSLGKVAVDLRGPENGPRIVLVHGTAAWSGFWREVSDDLAAQGWRVIAVDTPPFGYSERDPAGRYDRVSQARRLAELIRAIGGKATVVGHSFGAGAAVELALTEPQLVERLVLVDAALGKLDPAEQGKPGALASALQAAPLGQGVTAATITNPLLTEAMLKSFVSRKDSVARWVPVVQQPMRREGSTAAYARWLPNLFIADEGARSRHRSALAQIAVPVRLIWGEADTVTPPDQARALQPLLHAPGIEWVRGAGHIPHVEAPAEFITALHRALAPETAPPLDTRPGKV